jgi:hypothetical protein
MEENEIIADKLNIFIHEMMKAAQSLAPKPSEYLVFNYPNESNCKWYILIFFPDATQHNEAIKNGVCYQIHKFVWDTMNLSNDFKGLNKTILFESGIIPKEEMEMDKMVYNTIKISESLIGEQGQTNPEICSICGHHSGGHQAMGIPDEVSGIPSGGWMTCSEEYCNCFRTWDLQVIDESPQN